MKKLSAVLLLLALCSGYACAEGEVPGKIRTGYLSSSGISAEEYDELIEDCLSNDRYPWTNYINGLPEYLPYLLPRTDKNYETDAMVDFDSINEMLMALDAGKIDAIEIPSPVGKYLLRQTVNAGKYVTLIYSQGVDYYLSMGFKEGSKWFEPFNAAIKAMNEDDTLLLLKAKYIDYAKDDLKPITFEKFPDAETVKITVTGDLPPIDYVAADGTPAGFNTALLAEIGRRLKVNVELLSINAGARAAALSSGRADGVFWFWSSNSIDGSQDIPKGVVLTEPYYSYDTEVCIGRKISK